MANHCEDCEYSKDCDIAYITEFCEDCKDYYTCNILSECKAGYSVECNNGFESKNDYADDYDDEDF